MRGWVIDWRQVPWSLWAFEGVLLANLVVIEATVSAPVGPLVFAPFLILLWAYAMLRGIRWLWFCTLAIYVVTIPEIVLGSVSWAGSGLTILGLVFLLLPATRHYFARANQTPPTDR
jgi:hypothetical protein